ncbi:hypothetical protein [Haladaptatus sp. DYF46]|uniref:hypothetical protein n=1 Tax=Haladaptatus sp. DYF46 TaxID=2886041 RepID=UPI001E4F99E5|nr:hypothetical protein [Haladaptatus sp. DYF46]
MNEPTPNVTRRTFVAAATGLVPVGSNRVDDTENDRESAGRLLFDNDTNGMVELSVSMVRGGMKRVVVSPNRGPTTTVRYPTPLSEDPPVLDEPIVEMKPVSGATIVRKKYLVPSGEGITLLIPTLPRQSSLFYTTRSRSKGEGSSIEKYGKVRCSSVFDVYLRGNGTQTTCGSRISRLDDRRSVRVETLDVPKPT